MPGGWLEAATCLLYYSTALKDSPLCGSLRLILPQILIIRNIIMTLELVREGSLKMTLKKKLKEKTKVKDW